MRLPLTLPVLTWTKLVVSIKREPKHRTQNPAPAVVACQRTGGPIGQHHRASFPRAPHSKTTLKFTYVPEANPQGTEDPPNHYHEHGTFGKVAPRLVLGQVGGDPRFKDFQEVQRGYQNRRMAKMMLMMLAPTSSVISIIASPFFYFGYMLLGRENLGEVSRDLKVS